MYVLRLYNPDTLATTGYIRVASDTSNPSAVNVCDTASHYFSPTTAALVRDRLKTAFPDQISAEECKCLVGLHYTETLRPAL